MKRVKILIDFMMRMYEETVRYETRHHMAALPLEWRLELGFWGSCRGLRKVYVRFWLNVLLNTPSLRGLSSVP